MTRCDIEFLPTEAAQHIFQKPQPILEEIPLSLVLDADGFSAMLSLIILVAIVVVGGIRLYRDHRKRYAFADAFPGLRPLYPLVGNGDIMWKSDVAKFDTMVRIFSENDRVVKVWAGPKLLLFTAHPDLVQQLLSSDKCLEKPFLYAFAGFETGLFTSKRKHRGSETVKV